MKIYALLIITILSLSLSSCGGGYSDTQVVYAVDYKPSLVRFDLVDSYGLDTAKSALPLAINPYKDGGLFDVFWSVNSLDDYRVNLRINDMPNNFNTILVYSKTCGARKSCDQNGNAICQYTSDLYVSCNNSNLADISSLFKRVPQKLYMILEVCSVSSSYCTYDYYPVTME